MQRVVDSKVWLRFLHTSILLCSLGPALLHKLRYLLNDKVQVFELIPNGPGPGLRLIKKYLDSNSNNNNASPDILHYSAHALAMILLFENKKTEGVFVW